MCVDSSESSFRVSFIDFYTPLSSLSPRTCILDAEPESVAGMPSASGQPGKSRTYLRVGPSRRPSALQKAYTRGSHSMHIYCPRRWTVLCTVTRYYSDQNRSLFIGSICRYSWNSHSRSLRTIGFSQFGHSLRTQHVFLLISLHIVCHSIYVPALGTLWERCRPYRGSARRPGTLLQFDFVQSLST